MNLDVNDKRALFVVGCVCIVLLTGLGVAGAATGEWNPFIVIACTIFGVISTFGIGHMLWQLSKQIFPDNDER